MPDPEKPALISEQAYKYTQTHDLPLQIGTLPMYHQQKVGVDDESATALYGLSIVASLCCMPVFGIIGLVHAIIAKHEGERGNIRSHQARLYQAKWWTGSSIILGIIFWILVFVCLVLIWMWNGYSYAYGCWYIYNCDYDYFDGNYNYSTESSQFT